MEAISQPSKQEMIGAGLEPSLLMCQCGEEGSEKKGLAKRKKGKVKDDLMVWLASCSRWIHALPPGGLGLCASPEPNPASKDPVRTFVLDLSSVLLQADWRAMLLEKTHVMYLC